MRPDLDADFRGVRRLVSPGEWLGSTQEARAVLGLGRGRGEGRELPVEEGHPKNKPPAETVHMFIV